MFFLHKARESQTIKIDEYATLLLYTVYKNAKPPTYRLHQFHFFCILTLRIGDEKIMKKLISMTVASILVSVTLLTGCGTVQSEDATTEATIATTETASETSLEESTETATSETSATETVATTDDSSAEDSDSDAATVRVGSLKGPTTMGLVNLMNESDQGEAEGSYSFTMETQPDTLMADIVGGDVDIALIPANMASVLYNKMDGDIEVLDINTLGVLECITGDDSIESIKDLSGKTVVTTGQGSTPEYALDYLLEENGVTNCTLEFESEATQIAAELEEDSDMIAVLPQPFATVALMQNDSLRSAFSLTDEWDSLDNGSRFLTGVTVVTKDFLEQNQDAVDLFMQEQEESVDLANSDVEGTAELVAQYGIVEKAAVAEKALPSCNIVDITGDEMQEALSGFLQILYDQDSTSVGGTLPIDDFYYIQTSTAD